MKVRYYLRDKITQELSQPFAILECAMMFKRDTQEIYEVITGEEKKMEVMNEFYDDIIEIALYGGVDYWSLTYNPITKELLYEDPVKDAIASATLDRELIKEGLEKVLEDDFEINSQYRNMIMKAVYDVDAGQIDAICSDIIVQAGIFGEIIYG